MFQLLDVLYDTIPDKTPDQIQVPVGNSTFFSATPIGVDNIFPYAPTLWVRVGVVHLYVPQLYLRVGVSLAGLMMFTDTRSRIIK